MMGGHHAITGTAAWLAVTTAHRIPVPHALAQKLSMSDPHVALGLGLVQLGGVAPVLSGALVATGAALLPDVDHPGATIARSGGAVTKGIAKAVSKQTGHRGATHTPVGVFVFLALSILVSLVDWRVSVPVFGEVQVLAVATVTAMCVFAVRAMKIVRGNALPWLIGVLVGLVVAVAAPDSSFWLPLAIGVGAATHLLGDLLTTDGLPSPTWPLVVKPPKGMETPVWKANGDVALPILGNAGSKREWFLCAAVTVYVLVVLAAVLISPWL